MEPTALQILWFVLIAVLFIGYFVLEGFDFGVGMDVLALGSGDRARRGTILGTIGPVWDGNEVWLITGAGAMFAAFPEWYASLFSGFYLLLLLILLVLIVRVCAFKYRSKSDSVRWQRSWDTVHVVGGVLPPLLWGLLFGNIVAGVPMDGHHWVTASVGDVLGLFPVLTAVVMLGLFWLHGTLYLALRTTGELASDARRLAVQVSIPVPCFLSIEP